MYERGKDEDVGVRQMLVTGQWGSWAVAEMQRAAVKVKVIRRDAKNCQILLLSQILRKIALNNICSTISTRY